MKRNSRFTVLRFSLLVWCVIVISASSINGAVEPLIFIDQRDRALSTEFPFVHTTALAVRTWDGGGVTNNWSEAANWSGDTVPTSGDNVVFDATSTKNATIDISVTTFNLSIAAGYTGTISMAPGVNASFGQSCSMAGGTFNAGSGTVTLGSNGFGLNMTGGTLNAGSGPMFFGSALIQSGGTFNGGSGNVSGAFNLTGGTFNAPSGNLITSFEGGTFSPATFFHNNGTVTFTGGNANFSLASTIVFNNLTINKNEFGVLHFPDAGRTIRVVGTLSLIEGRLSGPSPVIAEGAINIAPTFGFPDSSVGGSGTILIKNGATARMIDWPSTASLPHIRIDDANATVTVSGAGTTLAGAIHILNGAFEGGSTNLEFGYGASQGYLQSGGTFHIGSGNLTLVTGGFQLGGGTFTMDNGNATFPCFLGVTISGGTFNASTGTTSFCSTGDFNGLFTQSAGVFDARSGTVDINHRFELMGGTFIASSGNTHFGFVYDRTGGTFSVPNGGTVFFDSIHGAYSINVPGSETFHNVTFNTPGQIHLSGDTLIANGNLRMVNGVVDGGTLHAKADVIVENTADGGSASVTFNGAGSQTFNNAGGANTTGTWTVDKPVGTILTAATSLTLGAAQPLNISSGTLYLGNGSNMTAGALAIGANGRLVNDSATTITLGANASNNGILDLQGSGAACPEADTVLLRSSVAGMQRQWSGSGIYRLVDVDLRDMIGPNVMPLVTVFSSTGEIGGNNANWNFTAGCPTALTISPLTANVPTNGTQQFTAGGGFVPRTFSVPTMIGSIDQSGLYTAGSAGGVSDTVRVTDAFGSTADAKVNIIGTAARVAFVTHPSNTTAGQNISPAIQVAIKDKFGNTVPNATNSVTLSIQDNPGGGTLSGSVTRSAVAGVATFDDLSIDKAASGYTLLATSASLTSATSNGFDISVGVPARLGFVVQPSNVGIGIAITPAVEVEILDASGNRVTTATDSVTMAIGTNPGGGVLSGTLSQIAVAGVATFSDLSINAGGIGYTLAASALGLTSEGSSAFNVVDPFQVTNTNDAGAGSFRQAIINSNDTPGMQTISFNIPPAGPHTITLSSLHLPTITDPVVIDGTTQPGYGGAPIVKIRGVTQFFQGMSISAGNTTVKGLVLDHFQQAISIHQGGGNVIEGNYIGTDTSGNSEGDASTTGILIQSSNGNRIGGNTPAARNLISGNLSSGILIVSSNDTLIQGNYIGTNAAGGGDVGNGTGIYLSNTNNTVIGGDTAGARNVISGNSAGVTVWNPNPPTPTGNFIKGNYIGTDATGSAAIPNDNWGIWLTDTSNVVIGGTQPGEGNLISGNTLNGILISNWTLHTTILMSNLVIKGNLIGTDSAGTAGIPNGAGIFLMPYTLAPSTIGISNITIGGPEPGARNVISGNLGAGIAMTRFGLTDLSIKGNHIGADAVGTAGLPNYAGVSFYGFSGTNSDLYIGGPGPGEGNLIAFNATNAVYLGSSMRGVTVRGNSIHSNLAYWYPALSLFPSPNSNEPCDVDTGANNRQNHPELTSLLSSGGSTTIDGTLNSEPNKTYTIDFYSNESCGLLGLGQGRTYLGSTTVTTGAVCAFPNSTPFSATFPVSIPAGHQVMATATDPDGNTSEFSRCLGPSAKIEGTILDSNSQPVRSVSIEAKDLGDGTTRYASTNASGRFTVGGLPLGRNYRIKPARGGYTFTPATRTYNGLSTNQDDPYIANGALTIRGQVTRTAQTSSLVPTPAPIGPFPLGGVTITLTGPTNQTVVTTSDGNYQLHNLLPGTYTITPSKLNHTFTPPSTTLTISTNIIANFSAQSVGLDGLTGRFVFDSAGDINVMNADGSGLMTIIRKTRPRTGPQYDYRYPRLSKDGSKLVYSSYDIVSRTNEMWTSAADGSSRTLLRSSSLSLIGHAFSPDGSKIAFGEGGGTAAGLWVMNSNGTNPVRILTDCRAPDWSPDGLKLVFSCNNPAQIFTANADGSNFAPFYTPGSGITALFSAWSPDGTKIAIARRIQSTGTSQIVLKNVTGGAETVIASSTSVDYNGPVSWSPDGNWISARTLPQGVSPQIPKLIALSSDGSHQLTISDPAPGLFMRWGATNSQPTPAGSNVAIQTGNVSITIQSVSGAGGVTTVTPIPPASAGQVSGGFVVGGQGYEISTTAIFTPPVTVCFTTQNAISVTAFNQLSLMHNEGGVLVDRTTTRNYSLRQICGQVTSFSPFVLAQLIDPSLPDISGIVVDPNGVPLADISIALTGDEEQFVKTDFNGEFIFPNLVSGGNYAVTATQAGYTYFLPNQLYPNLTGSQATVFVATPASFDISGTVRDATQQPMAGITVALSGADDNSTVTDANGNYSFVGLPADTSYSVAPSSAQFQFNPTDTAVGPLGANAAGVDFVQALAPTAAMTSVSGRVTTADGSGIGGAVITIEGGSLDQPVRVRTNPFGYYRFDDLLVGETYVLTISSKWHAFNPPTRVMFLVDEVTDADWVGEGP